MKSARTKPRYWKSLPKEDKEGIVRHLLELGYTCKAIGVALGTTKNAVVGYQHSHLSDLTGRSQGTSDAVPADILLGLLQSEWPLKPEKRGNVPKKRSRTKPLEDTQDETSERAVQNEPEDVAASAPERVPAHEIYRPDDKRASDEQRTSSQRIKPKIAVSEAVQCTYEYKERHRCAYEWTNALTKRCDLH